MSTLQILEDDRQITRLISEEGRIVADATSEWFTETDKEYCTEIVAYGEPAFYNNVPWLAVYRGKHLYMRIPAGQVRIVYAEEPA